MTTKSSSLHLNKLGSQPIVRKLGHQSNLSNPLTHTSPNFSKNLPSLNVSEPNQSLFIKQTFEEFSDSVSRFLRTSNSSVSYRDSLSTNLAELNHNFDSFYSYIQKQSGVRFQNRNTNLSNRTTFKTSATAFSDTLTKLIEELNTIRTSSGSDILESLITNFDKVIENISKVLSHPNTRLSVHDPIIPIAKGLKSQINLLKQNALQISDVEKGQQIDQYHLLIEIRNFSSDLNNAFTNEFARCSYGMNENEKLRSVSMSACNDILQGTKSLINFKSQMIASLESFEKFRKKMNAILKNLNLPLINSVLPNSVEEEEEEKSEVKIEIPSPLTANLHNENNNSNNSNQGNPIIREPEIHNMMTIKEIIGQSREFITKNCCIKKFCDNFFSVMNSKADLIETKEINLFGQITDLQAKYSDLTTKTRILEQQNQNLKDNLTTLQNRDHTDNYFECIKYLSKKIQDYLEDGAPVKPNSEAVLDQSSRSIIEKAFEMADQLKNKRCPNCSSLETNCSRVKEILLSIDNVKDSNNLIVVAESAYDSYKQLLNSYNSLTKNLKQAKNDNDQSRSHINIILNEFPSADLNNPDVCDEIIKQIRNEREMSQSKIDAEISNSRQRISKFEKDISNKFSQTFNTEPSLPLLSQFKAIQTELKSNKELIDEIHQRLSKHLSINSNDKNILDLLDILENKESSSQTFTEQEKNSISQLNECENRILALLARSKSEPKPTFSAAIRSLNLAVNSLSEHIDGIDKNERLKKSYLSQSRSSLEMIYLKLLQFLHIKEKDDVDHSKINLNDLIMNISELVEKVIQNSANNSPLSASVVNKIFQNVLPLVNQSSKNDPLLYLQEISNNYLLYLNSFDALKPFGEILNNIFQNFDCKIKSFSPDSSSFSFIKQEIYKLHNSLNSIGPSKIHSLLFLVLSRFVALTSSFLSAISSLEFRNEHKETA